MIGLEGDTMISGSAMTASGGSYSIVRTFSRAILSSVPNVCSVVIQ